MHLVHMRMLSSIPDNCSRCCSAKQEYSNPNFYTLELVPPTAIEPVGYGFKIGPITIEVGVICSLSLQIGIDLQPVQINTTFGEALLCRCQIPGCFPDLCSGRLKHVHLATRALHCRPSNLPGSEFALFVQ